MIQISPLVGIRPPVEESTGCFPTTFNISNEHTIFICNVRYGCNDILTYKGMPPTVWDRMRI